MGLVQGGETFVPKIPSMRIVDLASGDQRPLIQSGLTSFAPRYSPDGSRIVFSMMNGGNSDIYAVNATGGIPQRLTTSPGIVAHPATTTCRNRKQSARSLAGPTYHARSTKVVRLC